MDFSRQLKSLYSTSIEIEKKDGVFSNDDFHERLKEFNTFYEEIKTSMKEHLNAENPLVVKKISTLPTLSLKGYDNPFSANTILYAIGAILFFPAGIIYLITKYLYVQKIKSQLAEISRSVSSIEFLIRDK